MKIKKTFGLLAAVAVVAAAGWSYQQSKQYKGMSELTLANVEALANWEGDGGNYYWSREIDCIGSETGSYRVCESNGPGNSCSNPGGKTCDCGRNC